jgi:cob(I)alamin adenosyltransferase
VARRAERSVVAVPSESLPQEGPRLYLNRLSDLLFVLARTLNRHAGRSDVLWEPKRNEPDKG